VQGNGQADVHVRFMHPGAFRSRKGLLTQKCGCSSRMIVAQA